MRRLMAMTAVIFAVLTGLALTPGYATAQTIVSNGWEDGTGGDYNSFIFFDDPDGNGWAIQDSPILRAELEAARGA